MSTTNKKDMMFYVHIAITLFFMFVFGKIVPPIEPLTKLGMECIVIFIGIVYAWSFTSIIWPSLLGMIAIIFTGAYTMTSWLTVSFANSTVVFLLFIFVFAKIIEDAGLISYLASWIMSRKIIEGKPWLFTFFILLGAFVGGILISGLPTTIIFWSILYDICRKFGFKPYDLYPSLMIFAIIFVSVNLGDCILPFKISALFTISTVAAIAPEFAISSGLWLAYWIPISLILIVSLVGIMKYIFRIDLSAMSNVSADFVKKEDLVLDKKQKTCGFFLIFATILLISIDLVPSTWAIKGILTSVGTIGVMMIVLSIMLWIKVDGEPLVNFKQSATGISWDMIFMFACIFPFSQLLTSDATGVKTMLVQFLTPFLSGFSPIVLAIVLALIGAVLTNISNNAILAIIFINISIPIFTSMGFSPLPFIFIQGVTIQLAYMTPAASAAAALVLGNEWIKPSMMYKYLAITLILLFIITVAVSMPYLTLLIDFYI